MIRRGGSTSVRGPSIGRAVGAVLVVLAVGLLLFGLATAEPGDPTLYPPSGQERHVTVHVVNHGLHSALILPVDELRRLGAANPDGAIDLLARTFEFYPWIEIGWGDEAFYRNVPSWQDIDWSLALKAMSGQGGGSVFHVVGVPAEPIQVFPTSDVLALHLSEAGFERLATVLATGFSDPEQPVDLGPGLYGSSRFFRSGLQYAAYRTCNHWTASLLAAAGVPVSQLPAVLPAGSMLELRFRAL